MPQKNIADWRMFIYIARDVKGVYLLFTIMRPPSIYYTIILQCKCTHVSVKKKKKITGHIHIPGDMIFSYNYYFKITKKTDFKKIHHTYDKIDKL